MRESIMLDEAEVKALIAKEYEVPVKDVIRSKFSYMVLGVKGKALLNKEQKGDE